MANKKSVLKLQKLVKQFIIKYGGEIINSLGLEGWTVGIIDTNYGKLRISIPDTAHKRIGLTIFERFEQPHRSKIIMFSNAYSGKWNFHSGINDPQECFILWKQRLDFHKVIDNIE